MKNQTLSLKALNELLSAETRRKFKVSASEGHQGIPEGYDGNMGDYNESFEYYKHPELPENIFLQITKRTNSYGDNESIYEMKFVEGKAKTITVYEPIK